MVIARFLSFLFYLIVKVEMEHEQAKTLLKEFRGHVYQFLQLIHQALALPDTVHSLLLKALLKDTDRALSSHSLSNIDIFAVLSDLVDAMGGILNPPFDVKFDMLASLDIIKRLELVEEFMKSAEIKLRVQHGIVTAVKGYLLSHPSEKQALSKYSSTSSRKPASVLNEDNDIKEDLRELNAKLRKRAFPEQVQQVIDREWSRLQRMPSHAMEYNVIMNYLEIIADIPWASSTLPVEHKDVNIQLAKEQLDRDHYGLERVKQRVLEFLAVLKLRIDMADNANSTAPAKQGLIKGPILCLVGPPGVGKTSLGRSIAAALDRPFVRISLGGIRDEAELRGHRRTYVGAMPGRIIQALRQTQSYQPVIVLDEVDKIGYASIHGDPSAALLEILDPEQNFSFTDHYVALPVNLSHIMFICTANRTDTIPPALLDRMEIINVPGYTLDEKAEIAENYLIPKQILNHALSQLNFENGALDAVIQGWTRESGVRQLERVIAAICRRKAMERVERLDSGGGLDGALVGVKDLEDILGVILFVFSHLI